MREGTRSGELIFLHLVRSMDHIERSSVPKVRNIDVVSFMLGWAQ
jgi:hypothetical protein